MDPPDVDRGGHLAATYIAGCCIAFVFVAMRLCARFSIAGVGIDDWCMLVTWIVFLPSTIIVSIFSFDGGTRHLQYLAADPVHLSYVTKLNWIAQPLVIFCLGSGKIAVAFLIIRLLNRASVWRRYSLYVTSFITVCNTVVMIVLTFAQCEDPRALWDQDVKAKTKCWDPSVQSSFSIYGAAFHAAMDFFLAIIPITLVWGLKTDLRKRIALCGLLGCGNRTGICAAIKTSKLVSLNARSDITWEDMGLFLWTGIEIILLIVCGSIPALKPIYAICMGRRMSTMRSSQRTPHGTGLSKKAARKSYARHSDSDTAFVMEERGGQSGAVVSRVSTGDRVSEDEVGLAVTSFDGRNEKYEGGMGDGIKVTQRIDVEYREVEQRL
ncbi:hypothetical protein BDV96DRAFT_509034 [Lophiotrema nucula]|uniref:Rhodopsin domain-containing protein n=1 Tax=Lophiotrema nucula TaxID=690887 RepID=A0A6A5YHG2_9PLEO|nr:hypothetical protein BDV96DRAFT_509034 [Lophiotrema nucula]